MVFKNNSSKGIFGEIKSDLKKLKLSGDSRWLQKVAPKEILKVSESAHFYLNEGFVRPQLGECSWQDCAQLLRKTHHCQLSSWTSSIPQNHREINFMYSKKNLAFHSLLRRKMIITTNSHYLTFSIIFSLVWRIIILCDLGSGRVNKLLIFTQYSQMWSLPVDFLQGAWPLCTSIWAHFCCKAWNYNECMSKHCWPTSVRTAALNKNRIIIHHKKSQRW